MNMDGKLMFMKYATYTANGVFLLPAEERFCEFADLTGGVLAAILDWYSLFVVFPRESVFLLLASHLSLSSSQSFA